MIESTLVSKEADELMSQMLDTKHDNSEVYKIGRN